MSLALFVLAPLAFGRFKTLPIGAHEHAPAADNGAGSGAGAICFSAPWKLRAACSVQRATSNELRAAAAAAQQRA